MCAISYDDYLNKKTLGYAKISNILGLNSKGAMKVLLKTYISHEAFCLKIQSNIQSKNYDKS